MNTISSITPAPRQQSIVSLDGGQLSTTSVVIAEFFSRKHYNVLQSIDRLECSPVFRQLNFQLTTYLDAQGRPQRMYRLTRDGFMWLAMGFTGPEAARWKEGFIAEFNRMEAALKAVDQKALARAQTELARTQRQLIVAQKSLLAQTRRELRRYAAPPVKPAASTQLPLDLAGGAQ